MTDRDEGTKPHTSVTASDPAKPCWTCKKPLGTINAQSLFAQQRPIWFSRCLTDFWYFEATAQMLRDANLADLNEKIAMLACQRIWQGWELRHHRFMLNNAQGGSPDGF